MRTRSQTKASMATQNNPHGNVLETGIPENSENEFEINNQLGLETAGSSEVSQVMENNEEINSLRARGQESEQPRMDLSDVLNLLRQQAAQQAEELRKMAEEQEKRSQQQAAEQKKMMEQLAEQQKLTAEKLTGEVRQQLQQHREETRSDINAFRQEVADQLKAMRGDIDEQKKNWKEQFEVHQQKTTSEIKELSKKQDSLRKEQQIGLEKNRSELKELVQQNSVNLTQEVRKIDEQVTTVVAAHKETAEKLETVTIEKRRKLEELNSSITTVRESQERLQRRIKELDGRPVNRPTGGSVSKELVYNGRDQFPMEFLKELTEVYETYYKDENTKWIGGHLVEEASTWWKIIRDRVNNFEQFKELFTDKYWGPMEQEKARDYLEYGKYRHGTGISMIQYMEKCVLESRQLLPVLSDRHLIKKIARHFDREVQTAVVMRGVETIGGFEQLLKEYMMIAPRQNYNTSHQNHNDVRRVSAETPVVKQETRARDGKQTDGNQKPWNKTPSSHVRNEYKGKPAVACVVTQSTQQRASDENTPSTSRGTTQ